MILLRLARALACAYVILSRVNASLSSLARSLGTKQSSRHLAFVTGDVDDDMVLLRCRFLQSADDDVLSLSSPPPLALTFFEAEAEGPPAAAAAEWGSGLSAGPPPAPPSPAWRNISKASSSAASRLAVMSQNCLPSDETTLM